MFKIADKEFHEVAVEIYKKFEGLLSVHPDEMVFLRTDREANKYAYAKMIRGEYELLTQKKFFIVIISEPFDKLDSEEKKKWVLLHEMLHCQYSDDKGKYHMVDHDVKNFSVLMKDATWNTEMVKDIKNIPKIKDEKVEF